MLSCQNVAAPAYVQMVVTLMVRMMPQPVHTCKSTAAGSATAGILHLSLLCSAHPLQMSFADLQPATSFKAMSSTKSGSFKVEAENGAAAAAAAECVNGDGVVLEQGPTCLPPADAVNTVQGKCTASRRECRPSEASMYSCLATCAVQASRQVSSCAFSVVCAS
jgi:hypothetical protein